MATTDTKKHERIKLLAGLTLLVVCTLSTAKDVDAKALAIKHCADCHGETGNSEQDEKGVVPKIAGFSAILLFDSLDQFKHKDRVSLPYQTKDKQVTSMNKITEKLTAADAEVIAYYYSKQIFNAKKLEKLSAGENRGKQLHIDLCDDCHGKLGTSSVDDAPLLLGQKKNYLQRQFNELSEYKRYMPRRMKRKFKKLTKQDKLALIEFYTIKAD
jgi:cytochrome c553